MSGKKLDVPKPKDGATPPTPNRLWTLVNGVRYFKSLHFGAVAGGPATDKTVRLTKDFATRPNLCLATNLCMNNFKDSHASTLSSWSLKIDRISASPDAAEVRYTQTPLRVFLLCDYEAVKKLCRLHVFQSALIRQTCAASC